MNKIALTELYENCILSSIAHAIFVGKEPFFSYEQSWNGNNYSFLYGTSRGTISFDITGNYASGAARDDSSTIISQYPALQAIDLFEKAPTKIKELATAETLMYLFDKVEDFEGPVITAAFWHDNNTLSLDKSEEDFIKNGGEFLATVLTMDSVKLKDYWQAQYDLTTEEAELVDILFKAFKAGERNIKLDNRFRRYKKAETITSLSEIGINLSFKLFL